MGCPKLGKPTTSAEAIRKWKEKESNKDSKKEMTRSRYNQNKASKTIEQLEKEREKNRVRKALPRQRIKEKSSCQKLHGLKLKEKNRKKKRESNNPSTSSSRPTIPLSTERVRKHRENKRLLVNLNFNHSFTSTRRTRYLATKMKSTLNSVS